ncbi:MAG: amidohydrolase [Solirubrobacterales bacterium]|nr:amidohydrolase [Solirubrobacterales bacterium]
MRTIALEEHCLTPELRDLLGPQIHPYYAVHRWPPALEARLMDLGEGRIAEMDAHGIDVQVLSTVQPGLEHSAAEQAVPVARAFNDRVAEALAAHPDRFAGFAALPTADPVASADELARAVRELGFKGALINGRARERFLDDEFFWPMFESAEALGVPIYLHPMPPPQAVYDAYYAGFGDDVSFMLAAPAWGWHIETGLHALRLILAGVLDRFPKLQMIIGHMGEVIPFMLARIDETIGGRLALDPAKPSTELSVPEYFERNFHITTSGLFTDPPLRCAIDTLGADKILFAVDHPFSDGAKARQWIDRAPITAEERAKITHENAERLLGL